MRIGVLRTQVPFVSGGAERHAAGLVNALQQRGHEATEITLPFKWYPGEVLADHIMAAKMLDLSEVEGVRVDLAIGLKFPAWLAPKQAAILNITERQDDFCQKVAETLENQGFRVDLDLRNEKIGYKIRQHTLARVPYLLVVGDREVENGTVAVRTRDGEDLGSMSVEAFAERLGAEVANRGA